MSQAMGIDALERILETTEPAEVAARYGQVLTPEARDYLASFMDTCRLLDRMSDAYYAAMPPVPTPTADQTAGAEVVPFPRRHKMVPLWALPLTAAAMLCLGVLLPREAPYQPDTLRGPDISTPKQDARISDAFYERGQTFQERGEHAKAWDDFRRALSYLPVDTEHQRDLILEDLKIVAEQLQDNEKLAWVATQNP